MSASEKRSEQVLSEEKRELLSILLEEEGFRLEQGDASPSAEKQDNVLGLSPKIEPAPDQRFEPFPLTDIQQAYWIGRSVGAEMGGNVALHGYFELDSADLDLERLSVAWRQVIERHDMLRAIVMPDGRQRILERVPSYELDVKDAREWDPGQKQEHLEEVRERLSHKIFPLDQWPQFEILATRLDEHAVRLHVSFDATNVDFGSFLIIFRDWVQLYQDSGRVLPPLDLCYRDYVLAIEALRGSPDYQRSLDYWRERATSLPTAPELPLAKSPSSVLEPRFATRIARLSPDDWRRLKVNASQAGLTPSGAILAAYAEVLAAWSKSQQFTVNVTLFNRLPLHPQVNEIAGDFTSMILLGVDNCVGTSFESRARHIQKQLWEGFENRYVSGVQVLRELARLQGGISGSIMPFVFTSTLGVNNPGNPLTELGAVVYSITQTPQVWLDHQVFEAEDGVMLKWDALEELFPSGMLDEMFDSYRHLLQLLSDDLESWRESRFQLLPQRQIQQRAAINATTMDIPEATLSSLFKAQAAARPDQTAVVSSQRLLSYAELSDSSNRLARLLRDSGARPDTLVAIVMEKGWEQVAAALGVVMSGAAYLPINPSLPKDALWYLLESAEAQLVLTQSWLDERLQWPEAIKRVLVDEPSPTSATEDELDQVAAPGNLAYVIYTSGSTGSPKGVMIEHRSVVNRIADVNHRFGVGPEDRVLALTALHHDLSVYDIFGTLAAGGTIILPDAAASRDPVQWVELMARERVTIWNSVPAYLEMLVEYVEHLVDRTEALPRSLRLALLAGDWVPVTLPDRLKALAEGVELMSLGGPTETTIWDICYAIETVDPGWRSIPYGKPMVNARYDVLNEALEPCPVWVPGQLYIGGCGLARGYWRDDEKTHTSFVVHPRTGERLYRSGDLGRYLTDGNIEFLGREDFQVKIQGQRIELGEIEATLKQHPDVRAAVVTAVEDRPGKKRLVGYAVAQEGAILDIGKVKSFLRERLPDHMVPSAIMLLNSLPLSPNGKIDRRALPTPVDTSTDPREVMSGETTPITARIAQLVSEVLGVGPVDPGTNLLNLGANSVDIVRIGNQLENEFGFRPKIEDMFRLPTIAALGGYYDERLRENRTPAPSSDEGLESNLKSYLSSVELILDPKEREEFKNKQTGLRSLDGDHFCVPLSPLEPGDVYANRFVARRSHRQFSLKPIPLGQLGRLLGSLRQVRINGQPKYLYGSAGGLYPVQTYLHLKAGRVEGVTGGIYYYHPVEHRLIALRSNVDLDRTIHVPFINQPVFDEAAFSIFFIATLDAIAPIYAERSLQYATLEAGAMAHLLEVSAPDCQLGLCQIGAVDFARIRDLFALDNRHMFVHSMLGGLQDSDTAVGHEREEGGEPGEADKIARMMEKVGQLTEAEVETLLEANKSVINQKVETGE